MLSIATITPIEPPMIDTVGAIALKTSIQCKSIIHLYSPVENMWQASR